MNIKTSVCFLNKIVFPYLPATSENSRYIKIENVKSGKLVLCIYKFH